MLAVGRISKSVGLRGEVRIALLTDDPKRFDGLQTVWIGNDEASAERHTISASRIERSSVVLKLSEIGSRTAADAQQGKYVFVEGRDAVKPKKGSYFIHDLIGMKVLTDEGRHVGAVRDVMHLPANDIWIVMNGMKELLIPAVKEVVVSVDDKRREIVIHAVEGLLE